MAGIVAFKDSRCVRLVSRTERDHAKRFPEVAAAVACLRPSTLILDGEVCVFNQRLMSRFYLLRTPATSPGPRPCSWRSTTYICVGGICVRAHFGIDGRHSKTSWTANRPSTRPTAGAGRLHGLGDRAALRLRRPGREGKSGRRATPSGRAG